MYCTGDKEERPVPVVFPDIDRRDFTKYKTMETGNTVRLIWLEPHPILHRPVVPERGDFSSKNLVINPVGRRGCGRGTKQAEH